MSETQFISQAKVIFVSDFFIEQYTGGAELTLEALALACPYPYVKIQSKNLTRELVALYKDKVHWILVNYTGVSKDVLIDIALDCKYSVIECDYKYCKYRSSHLHKLNEQTECKCNIEDTGKFTRGFFKRSTMTWFMSQGQLEEYYSQFPSMKKWTNLDIQGSTWTSEHLDKLLTLGKETAKNDKFAVLSGASWIKNQSFIEEHLNIQGIQYELVGNLPYDKFIEQLSKYKGLCFIPKGYDTCPRIVIEAKIMGLETELGDLVQIKNDKWFNEKTSFELVEYLKTKPKTFWEKFKENTNLEN